YTENLQVEVESETDADKSPAVSRRTRNELRGDAGLVRLLRTSVEKTSDDDGWAHLSKVGKYIQNNGSFSPLNYGYRKLSELIRASELFVLEMRNDNTAIYIKDVR
ncbi:MAG TPA: OST-HTH/LOTUS domain-containing protein, partial [Gammaproteobacteria bacterium]|nr:OST-HTH/LOTUS domain-containing protein [Gammaproteobacteria bacterium]